DRDFFCAAAVCADCMMRWVCGAHRECGRFICIRLIKLKRCEMMFSANAKSILKGWAGDAVAVLVRLKALAPYALIEIVLPGGSLVALGLWLYRRRKDPGGIGARASRFLS